MGGQGQGGESEMSLGGVCQTVSPSTVHHTGLCDRADI